MFEWREIAMTRQYPPASSWSSGRLAISAVRPEADYVLVYTNLTGNRPGPVSNAVASTDKANVGSVEIFE